MKLPDDESPSVMQRGLSSDRAKEEELERSPQPVHLLEG